MEDESPPPITPNGSSLPMEAPAAAGGWGSGSGRPAECAKVVASSHTRRHRCGGGRRGGWAEAEAFRRQAASWATCEAHTFLAGAGSEKPISSRAFSAELTFVDAVGAGADSSPSCSSEGGRPSASRRPSSRATRQRPMHVWSAGRTSRQAGRKGLRGAR